jgi:threonine dehydrogenase-like Zn-dependent dehydrogenase
MAGVVMRALCLEPGKPHSARVDDVPEPAESDGALLVKTLAAGICGTDREMIAGRYGWPPPHHDHLVIGHESLGQIEQAPPSSGFQAGDLVVGIVRRPDPVPCRYCARGEWDMCCNGRYTERGIKQRDGYASERFRLEPEFAVKISSELGLVGVLLEPASIVAKAWGHVERIGRRSSGWQPRTALVTGAGPVGLLAALMARQRGFDVHVFDQVTAGPKPQLVRDLGGVYHAGDLSAIANLEPDVVIECTGAGPVIADVLPRCAASGVVCLAGVSAGGHGISLDLEGISRRLVLRNIAVFGSVNANRSHYQAAAKALADADRAWLLRLITRRVALSRWSEALDLRPDDVKVILDFNALA